MQVYALTMNHNFVGEWETQMPKSSLHLSTTSAFERLSLFPSSSCTRMSICTGARHGKGFSAMLSTSDPLEN
jgi:hypothetical protein